MEKYYPNGQIRKEIVSDYTGSGQHGGFQTKKTKEYYENGQISKEEDWWVEWGDDGYSWKTIIEYYENGNIKSNYYTRNEKVVKHQEWDEDGNLIRNYQNEEELEEAKKQDKIRRMQTQKKIEAIKEAKNYEKERTTKESEKKTPLPKWYDGAICEKGGIEVNWATGLTCKLNNIELTMYHLAKESVLLNEWELVSKSLTWFKENNEEAYNILFEDNYWRNE